MVYLYIAPEWFFGYDVFLEIGFAIISLLCGYYAVKIHKLTEQIPPKLFGISFFLISASYFVQSFVNFAIISKLNENMCMALRINDVVFLNTIGIAIHMILFISGLSLLTYMSLKIRSWRVFILIWLICLMSIIFSLNNLYIFYMIASLMLVFVCIHYLQIYLRKRKTRNLLSLVAFAFLLFSTLHFIISVDHALFYMIGHILEFIAYILILINLLLALKK